MRLPCRLRDHRATPLRVLEHQVGISRATLSRIETGHQLPRDQDIPRLEAAYGLPFDRWYAGPQLFLFDDER